MESKRKLDFKLTVRQMHYEEISETLQLFGSLGFCDSLSTVQAYYETDPASFMVALDEDQHRVIGGCAAPLTTHQTNFIGVYVMDPKYQGLGIGVQLFNRCLDHVGKNNCGLSAAPEKFNLYRTRAGFKLMENVAMAVSYGKCEGADRLKSVDQLDSTRYQLCPLVSADYNQQLIRSIVKYDQKVHLECRDQLLRNTFTKPDITTIAVLEKETKQVVGYGCIKPNIVDDAMIGPLYAESDDIAEIILSELIRTDRTRSVQDRLELVTTDNSPTGLRLTKTLLPNGDMTRCEKLYTKSIPPFNYRSFYFCHTPDFSC